MVTKSKERIKKNGEVFTPIKLVNEILDKLYDASPELFNDPTKTFVDPACGDGNFIIEVIKRKIKHGSSPIQACKTTYGVELMQDNVDICKQRIIDLVGDNDCVKTIIDNNIVCANSLTEWDFENWQRIEPFVEL